MEVMNLSLIKQELKSVGFNPDADFEMQLHEKAALEHRKFSVNFQQEFDQFNSKNIMDFEMYFKWHERAEMYFPFAYKASLQNDIEKTQVLPLSNNIRIHAREAYNLLNGRAVNKLLLDKDSGNFYNTWFQLDFNSKDVHGNHVCREYRKEANQFVVAKHLKKYDIKGLDTIDSKVNFITSLYHGDVHPVTLLKDGKEFPAYVQASPSKQTLEFFNSGKKLLSESQIARLNQKNALDNVSEHLKRRCKGL